jgi:hypothetical protein
MSGAKDDRPGLAALMDYVREGDTVVVWKLDRLGRNTLHIRPGLDKTLRENLGVTEWITKHVANCDLDGNRFVWVSLRHPSRGNWHSLNCDYLHEVVNPTITEGRALVLDRL